MSKFIQFFNGFLGHTEDVRLALIKHNTKKNQLWFGGSMLALSAFIFALSFLDSNYVKSRPYFDPHRDYSRIPFDELDASNACRAETGTRYGENLVRLTLDSHSTRFDERVNMYKIFMTADVGNMHNYEEMAVHCFVDPIAHMIDHYRVFSSKQKSLLDRALGLFWSVK